ncbi:MAG: NAD-dependent DNA ligase LigA [Candidatus Portnoybacteria bacterium CG10_big_fil_rev_8_21_14_0_10_40_22]|uniref:DNA ligase n=1 Tax=Candidatus Portnoybacteria bacterium CG10_big_fil_rev_8_21_14_0_10_40_22 TaxID=1974814 RepID=A0A2M8KG40_9BACT|nr:MAG: NAD-dependent DNA ligase LigA [Candidatus Portnoybacteria bacterium CG10_big_fil_rev_8_21_14_0_10_40_22]
MVKQQVQQRILVLRKAINHHRYLYHVLDKQEIDDAAFDSLKHELWQLEQQFPDLTTLDSPTQRVGGEPLDKFIKVQHQTPMFSLEDVFSFEELVDWEKRIKKMVLPPNRSRPLVKGAGWGGGQLDYFVELKIDGFAVALIYEKGILQTGATRGNGKVGEDVTQNLKTIESIPLQLRRPSEKELVGAGLSQVISLAKIFNSRFEVRGEVVMTKKIFEQINAKRRQKNQALYANPRNTAAGSIRQLNPKIAASRHLEFLSYDIVSGVGQELHSQEHLLLPFLGFKVDKHFEKCSDLENARLFHQKINKIRDGLPYQIDGLVVSVDDNEIFVKLGVAGKAPRGAIAYKFPGKQATTIVEKIILSIGRTGALTPVAILKSVKVGGTMISRATLHNVDEIKRLDVRSGDTVVIQRAGDVIPDVVSVIKELRPKNTKEFKMPARCPVCNSPVVRAKGEVIYRCGNLKCGAILKEQFYHFVSRHAFDIVGLGPKIIDQLMDSGLIIDVADIFKLTEGDLVPLERFAAKSAKNLVLAINRSKQIALSRFIYALGIRHVGEETATDLAVRFGSLSALQRTTLDNLRLVRDIGEVVAKSIVDYFSNKRNLNLIDKLLAAGVKIKSEPKKIGQRLADQSFVFTGELVKMSRDQAKNKVRALGGDISESVSRQADFVVAGLNPGTKYQKAKKLGVKIIDEKEFLNMIF